jgi:UDP-N-acetylmuramyl pentapeptide phosphotransferase/UDP-N-acetylglucosamine-1-phosphate transferase
MLGILVLVVACLSWWMTGRLASPHSKFFLLDHPNARSLHDVPVPRTGGVAIIGSALLGLVAAVLLHVTPDASASNESGLLGWSSLMWILLLTVVLAGVSLLDDRIGLPVTVRLAAQISAGLILILGIGTSIPTVEVPLLGTVISGPASTTFSVVLLVWMTNLYNFMDGMDGLAGGMTVAGGVGLAFFAWAGQNGLMAGVALLVAGAATGFLIHNFPPARIFMGDVGSIPLGFFFGSLMILGSRDRLFDLWVPIILFSPFVADATVTLIRRVVYGEKIWEAHRSHYYQRAVLLGWGHRRTVIGEYVLMAVCAGLAALYQQSTESQRLIVLVAWGVILAALMVAVTLAERAISRRHVVAG